MSEGDGLARREGWPDGHRNPAGAWWCREHTRWECTGTSRRTELRCHASAIRYTDRCKVHAGFAPDVASARGYAQLTAWSAEAVRVQGKAPPVSPGEAVLGILSLTWLRVHYYAALLEAQVEEEGGRPGEDTPQDANAWLMQRYEAGEDADEDRPAVGHPKSSGLIGHVYAADKNGGTFASQEAIRALVVLEAQERDRCVKYADVAHKMGIAERQINLAEKQGEAMVGMIRRILDRMELTEEQRAMVSIVVPEEIRRLKEIGLKDNAA